MEAKCECKVDAYGEHLLLCAKTVSSGNNPRIERHNKIVKLIASSLKKSGKGVEVEEMRPRRTTRRPDISVCEAGQLKMYVEVTVVTSPSTSAMLHNMSRAASWKSQKYMELEADAKICKVVVAVTGGFAVKDGFEFPDEVNTRKATRQGQDIGAKKKHMFGQIAAALSNSFGQSIWDGYPRLTEQSQHRARPPSSILVISVIRLLLEPPIATDYRPCILLLLYLFVYLLLEIFRNPCSMATHG